MVLIQNWPPHLALAPIAQMDPPFMPFRDAGYSQADYTLSIQDIVYGVWRAKEEGLCALKDFSLEEYVPTFSNSKQSPVINIAYQVRALRTRRPRRLQLDNPPLSRLCFPPTFTR
jgi:hypothetical protein